MTFQPDGTPTYGETSYTWEFTMQIKRCGFLWLSWKPNIQISKCSGTTWYSNDDLRGEYHKNHELHHVNITNSYWDAFLGAVKKYTNMCVCENKATCYAQLAQLLEPLYNHLAFVAQLEYDLSVYDGPYQERARKELEAQKDEVTKAAKAVVDKEAECGKL